MKKFVVERLLIYVILLCASTLAQAFQLTVSEEHPFGLYYDDENVLRARDGLVEAEFLFDIPEQHYLYREKLKVLLETPGVTAELVLPEGEKKYDEFLFRETEVYYHQLVLPVKFKLDKALPSPQQISGKIVFQGCSGKICFRAMKQSFHFRVATQVMSEKTLVPETRPERGFRLGELWDYVAPARFEDVLKRGLFFSLLVTFVAGFATAFTPCVLPVIPLTLSFMGVSRRQRLFDKILSLLIFVAGLVLMYASLGVISALLGKTLGFWFQSLVFQIFLVLFFLFMGLWMLGAIQINLPATFQTRLARYHPQGHLAQLYAGLTIGFLAAPCVGPVIAPLLIYISVSRDVLFGFLLMLSFSLGLSVLFFLLGFFSQTWVRRFGEKSEWIKKILGGLLLFTAALYLWWIIKPHLGFQDSFFRHSLVGAEQIAREEKRGVLVDFYADWCIPCHKWDKLVWSDKNVQENVSKAFVPVKIDCTTESAECEAALSRFGVIGMPTVVFLSADLKEIRDSRLVGQEMSAGKFLEHLHKVAGP